MNDLPCVMLAFHCVVARLMSHDHVTQDHTEETRLCMKEFLSCVWELDVRVNCEKLSNATETKSKRKGRTHEAFHVKSNFMSLENMCHIMETIGLPRDTYDGSGRGEKPAQKVKPLIVRGVRLDMEQECFYSTT